MEVLKMLNQEQKKALDIMLSGGNVFLSGGAGTGKSYLIRSFLKAVTNKKRKKVLLCAPTGVAAVNIGGVTLHSAFHIPTYPCPVPDMEEVPHILYKTDILIIDEISMCRIDIFDYISAILGFLNKKIQVICVGDFYQLPPVITKHDKKILKQYYGTNKKWAFESQHWNNYNFFPIILTCNKRKKNSTYNNLLNHIAHGTQLEYTIKTLNEIFSTTPMPKSIKLCPIRREADQINQTRLSEIDTEKHTYIARISGDINAKDFQAVEKLELKRGCRVMSLVNYPSNNICNGSLGTVIDISDELIIVQFDSGIVQEITAHTWEKYDCTIHNGEVIPNIIGTYTQMPLKLAYAITIHKSQGQTYDSVNISPDVFTSGMLYVALSRCRNYQKTYITRPLRLSDTMVDPTVRKFYNNLVITPQSQSQSYIPTKRKVGRPSKYNNLKTITIRIPEIYKEKVQEYIDELLKSN